MNKKIMNKMKKLRKGDANVGLILLAFGAILAVAMYLYAKDAGTGVSNTTKGANSGVNTMNDRFGVSSTGDIADANKLVPKAV